MGSPNRSDRATAAFTAQIEAHEPERPPEPWTCPECAAVVPVGAFFCDHEVAEDGGALSQDMRPRLKVR